MGKNDDLIVLNTKSMTIGFVFYDELWQEESIECIKDIYIDVKLIFGQFFLCL